jgi:hypothetical protein
MTVYLILYLFIYEVDHKDAKEMNHKGQFRDRLIGTNLISKY